MAAAWQGALAAEQRAAFGYAVLGPHLAGTEQQLAVRCSDAHEALRNATRAGLAAAGMTPTPPQADYPDLYPVADTTAARALAVRLEDGCAAAWRLLYLRAASTTGVRAEALRPIAQAGLTDSAVRAAQWRKISTPDRASVPFPGT